MKYSVEINIMPHKGLLDPQGKAVTNSMKNIGLPEIDNVRVGKHMTMEIEAPTTEVARQMAEDACKRLLCNQVMESFEIKIQEAV